MNFITRRLPLVAALTVIIASPLALGLSTEGTPVAPSAAATAEATNADAHADKVERGRYLVTIAVCNDCHTPLRMGAKGPEPDMSRMLSGHPQDLVMPPAPTLPEGPWQMIGSSTVTAWAGPWGVSFTANLTPDDDTGIGLWTYENFRDTIRSGRHLGRGRDILPPMPIAWYKNFTDDDLEAIYQYLRTIPPVSNRVPEPLPPPGAPPPAKT